MREPFATALQRLRELAASAPDRIERARTMAQIIREAGAYHWVGLYDVTATRIEAIAWTGTQPPAYPVFPVTQGLSGAAVASGEPVIAQDVSSDARYLTTFAGSHAEAIFPVVVDGAVVGTIDVEGDRVNAFTETDTQFLQECTVAAAVLWVDATVDEI